MARHAPSPVAALVARFRRQRPLRSGSLIITLFGDAISPRGGAVTLGSLIRLARPFGLTERLVRTTVARLANEDWLVARRDGRLSEYRLSESGRRRFADATRRIYAAPPPSWSGVWTLVLIPGARAELREELEWLGFGQPNAGVFAHPTRSAADTREQLARLNVASAVVLESRSEDADADRELARAGWDLAELAGRYRRLVRTFDPVRTALERSSTPDPEEAFIVRTLLVHEYRKIHLRDPLLPEDLLPADWIGTQAYELCSELYSRTFEPAEAFLSRIGSRLEGPMPAPEPATFRRFGGLAFSSGPEGGRRKPEASTS
jgi:phenylacetic acid degradation operon negative regulatory protein